LDSVDLINVADGTPARLKVICTAGPADDVT
jgi:hypothetical protein